MTTGLAWNVSNPLKPYALFDIDARRDIPVSWVDWLADIGDTYGSHTIICEAPLHSLASAQLSGVITARIEVDPAQLANAVIGTKYGVTWRITSTLGQIDDQTLYLKLTEK